MDEDHGGPSEGGDGPHRARVSPAAPDVVYAVIEAANKAGGFFRSTNRGETWEKRGDYVPGGPQYYNEIFADPKEKDRVYSMDVWIQVTDDGGKTFTSSVSRRSIRTTT